MNTTTGRTRGFLALDHPSDLRVAYGLGLISWSPDSKRILVAKNDVATLAVVSATTGVAKVVASAAYGLDSVAWSTDGGRIAYVSCGSSDRCKVWTAKPDGTQAVPVAAAAANTGDGYRVMGQLAWGSH